MILICSFSQTSANNINEESLTKQKGKSGLSGINTKEYCEKKKCHPLVEIYTWKTPKEC